MPHLLQSCIDRSRLKLRNRVLEFVWRQIQQKRRDNSLNFTQSFRCFERNTIQYPQYPRFFPQFLHEMRSERFNILRMSRLPQKPENQLTRLSKLAVELLQANHRLELRRQKIQHLRIQVFASNDNKNRQRRDRESRKNQCLGSMRNCPCEELGYLACKYRNCRPGVRFHSVDKFILGAGMVIQLR